MPRSCSFLMKIGLGFQFFVEDFLLSKVLDEQQTFSSASIALIGSLF